MASRPARSTGCQDLSACSSMARKECGIVWLMAINSKSGRSRPAAKDVRKILVARQRHHVGIGARRTEQLLFQYPQLIAYLGGFLEFQILGVVDHLLLELLDLLADLFLAHGIVLLAVLRHGEFQARFLRTIDAVDQLADFLLDAGRRDAVGFVEGDLLGAAALGLINRAPHGIGYHVAVKNRRAAQVTCGAADG